MPYIRAMPSMEECAKQPATERLKRLERTADELVAVIRGRSETILFRRPDAKNWAAKEVICHLRDTEELFMARFEVPARTRGTGVAAGGA